jgi:Xaa-Pro dipeptidase
MFTRREFLSTSGVALVATQLPDSIGSLTSMKSQARPITNDERRGRIEKARRLMAQHKIDAIMLTQGTSLVYFTNIRWGGGERLFACVVPVKGEPFFVCPAFEEDRAREQIALGPFGGGKADVRTWNEDESPYALVAAGLRDRGIATGVLGIEETTKYVWSDGVADAAPQLILDSGSAVIACWRMI